MEQEQNAAPLTQLPDLQYAFYCQQPNGSIISLFNHEVFSASSIIKVPILLTWVTLERQGLLNHL
ncbi:MAG: hypothetical protein K0B14_06870 [Anaerolineaceae bacterium]|nr:hypothetical protein [Anaerolineaceae bacterium]